MYEIYERLRDSRGVSDYRVAQDTGISRAVLSSWKTGRYVPKTDKLQKIADYFNVSLDYLMTGDFKESYYLDSETATIMQKIFDAPGKRTLAKAVSEMTEEQALSFLDLYQKLTNTNDNNKSDSDA